MLQFIRSVRQFTAAKNSANNQLLGEGAMKLRDISLRSKLLFSNLVMVTAPLVVVAVLALGVAGGFSYFLNGEFSVSDSLGVAALYRLQARSAYLEKELLRAGLELQNGSLEENPSLAQESGVYTVHSGMQRLLTARALEYCRALEQRGALLALAADGQLIYLTKGQQPEQFQEGFFTVAQEEAFRKGDLLTISESGAVIRFSYPVAGGMTVYQVLYMPQITNVSLNTSIDFSGGMLRQIDRVLLVLIVIALVAVLLIDAIIVLLFNKGVLRPLRQLQVATEEVRSGNLDYPVEYDSKNEIGQVCEGFEQMRLWLRDTEDAQQRFEESRKDIIAGISHDLGTPLTSIKGYASGILEGIAATPEMQRRYLQIIYDTAVDMDKLVSEFALFSKLDTDVMPFYFEKACIGQLLEKYRFEMEETLRKNGIKLVFVNHCGGQKTYIKMDTVQLKRVFLNLLDNCVKYKQVDMIHSKAILTVDMASADYVSVVLESNGKVVTQEDCDKIFDTFYRTTDARTEVLNGSGLGLAVCKMIVERHGGEIYARVSRLNGLAVECLFPVVEIVADAADGSGEETPGKE